MSFYTGIITNKLAVSKQFYTELLGFSIKFENEWFVLLERDGRELAFMEKGLDFQAPIFRNAYTGNGIWLTIETENVKAEHARLINSGIKIEVSLRTEEWGETHFSVVDPNGIGIDFVSYREQ